MRFAMNSPALCRKLLHVRNMGFHAPERKDKIVRGGAVLGTERHRRYMLNAGFSVFSGDSEGVEVRTMVAAAKNRTRGGFLLVVAAALAACAGLPTIGGEQLPKDPTPAAPTT